MKCFTRRNNFKTTKKRGICDLEYQYGIKIIQWNDKRTVLILSYKPEHPISLFNNGKTTRGQPEKDISKPKAVLDYYDTKNSDKMSS